jgi:hypothetical protein
LCGYGWRNEEEDEGERWAGALDGPRLECGEEGLARYSPIGREKKTEFVFFNHTSVLNYLRIQIFYGTFEIIRGPY